MSTQHFERRDIKNAELHHSIAELDRELAQLVGASGSERDSALAKLQASWSSFVKLLELDPPHLLRDCPTCGKVGMLAATVCAFCWTKLTPPDGAVAASPLGTKGGVASPSEAPASVAAKADAADEPSANA